MISLMIVFLLSLLICCAIVYILALFWFSDIRNRRFRSFFLLGVEIFVWTLLNAVTMISDHQYYPIIYTLRMVMVCIVPFGVIWFILNFIDSPLKKSGLVKAFVIFAPAADVICMVTNPLHYKYFINYNFPIPGRGMLFWIHTGMDFLFIIITFILLIRYIIKWANKNPLLIFTGVGMLIPYTINILYSFGKIPFPHDVTPIGFFITYVLFVFVAYRLQFLNFKTSLFSSTMDSLDDLIFISNENREIVDVNRHALEIFSDFSVTLGRTKSGKLYEHIEKRVRDYKPDNLFESLRRGIEIFGECTLNLSNDEKRTYTVELHTVYENKKKAGYVLLLTDVSKYREMIEKLHDLSVKAETANQAKSNFLANMSHEIRTPMNAIIGMTNIGKSASDMERVNYCFGKIGDASKHLLGVINDILDMAKIEAGKFELAPDEFNFEKMLQRVVNVVNFKVEEKKQKFTVYVDRDIPAFLIGDEMRLSQVMTNLLGNAVKFTPENGSIGINTYFLEEKDGYCTIKISVKDTGIGISPEQQSRLFQSFNQAENDTARKFGGTGLGLSISKSIVEMMGGEIGIESEFGKGSKFIFTVKVKRGQKSREIISKNEKSRNDIRILITDDEPYIREDFKGILEKFGISCDAAKNAEEALAFFDKNGGYNLYFTDWKMPGTDGVKLTKILKEKSQPGSNPLMIMISAAETSEIAVEAREAGVGKFLQKPLFPSMITDIIDEYLGLVNQGTENAGDDISGIFENKIILLAEDVEINREIVQVLLEPTGIIIDCAKNGVEAVKMFGDDPDRYGVIFMDLQMPEMDGYEATIRIRSLETQKAKTVPIVAMTANVFKEDVEKCLEAGMSGHIGKPIDLKDVLEKLKLYL